MRYFAGLLAVIVLITIGVVLFGRGSKTPSPTTPTASLADLADTGTVVRYTQDGVINADQNHRAIRITVAKDYRLLEVVQGYSGNVIQSVNDYNTEEAYNVFLHSIVNQGFTKKRDTKNTDETGACPLGRRYNYEVTNSGQNDQNLWSSDCTGMGTFAGRPADIQKLFQLQINDYNNITQQVNLY